MAGQQIVFPIWRAFACCPRLLKIVLLAESHGGSRSGGSDWLGLGRDQSQAARGVFNPGPVTYQDPPRSDATEYPGGAIGRNGAPRASFAILLVDDDAAAADGLGVGASHAVIGAHLVVVDNSARTVQDLDPELIHSPAATDVAVSRSQQEAVARHSIDRAGTLVLGQWP